MAFVSTITVKLKVNKTCQAWMEAQFKQAAILYNACLDMQMQRIANGDKPLTAFDLAGRFRVFDLGSDYKDRIYERVTTSVSNWIYSEPLRYEIYWQHKDKQESQLTSSALQAYPFLSLVERHAAFMLDYRGHVKSLSRKQVLCGRPLHRKHCSLSFSIRPNRQDTIAIKKKTLSIKVPKRAQLIKGYYNFLPTSSGYQFKLATLKQDACGDYWLKLSYEEGQIPRPTTHEANSHMVVGVDMGLKTTRTAVAVNIQTQTVVQAYQPQRQRYFDLAYKALVWASNKDKRHLPFVHRKIARRRLDNIGKDIHHILNMGDQFKFGKPGSAFLLSGRLAKSASDAANSLFLTRFAKRAEIAGKEAGEVDESYTSVTCRKCLNRKAIPLSERTYQCGYCNHSEDRDLNSAYQIAFRPFKHNNVSASHTARFRAVRRNSQTKQLCRDS